MFSQISQSKRSYQNATIKKLPNERKGKEW